MANTSEVKPLIMIAIVRFACVLCILGKVNGDITAAMKESKVIPDVIDNGPKGSLKVEYESDIKVENGDELIPSKVKNQPAINWSAEDGAIYTLAMVDPDAPCRLDPTLREWQHWLVVKIPGTKIDDGKTLTEYNGPSPTVGSGLHRYVILLYKQPKELVFSEPVITNGGDERGKFSIKSFAAKYEMGDPIAGNFYEAKWDPCSSQKIIPIDKRIYAVLSIIVYLS